MKDAWIVESAAVERTCAFATDPTKLGIVPSGFVNVNVIEKSSPEYNTRSTSCGNSEIDIAGIVENDVLTGAGTAKGAGRFLKAWITTPLI
jgi:hypothetical protein